jgi:hypothetical protein
MAHQDCIQKYIARLSEVASSFQPDEEALPIDCGLKGIAATALRSFGDTKAPDTPAIIESIPSPIALALWPSLRTPS